MMRKLWLLGVVPIVSAVWLSMAVGQGAQPVADTPLTTEGSRTEEVSFGDFAADALCEAVSAPVAFVPAVAFKDGTINPGPFDQAAVNNLLQNPGETLAVSALTGAQIKAAMERSLSRLPLPSGAFLQIAGMTVTFDPKAPREHRVTRILIGGAPIDESRRYEVAMPLSLAKGGAGYFQIFDAGNIVRQDNTALGNAIYAFAEAKKHVSYTGQGRLVPSG
jgi:2',3'-cyclic-nucleotide 2'-phosphodiesterase (5'-nucleotidase family)